MQNFFKEIAWFFVQFKTNKYTIQLPKGKF